MYVTASDKYECFIVAYEKIPSLRISVHRNLWAAIRFSTFSYYWQTSSNDITATNIVGELAAPLISDCNYKVSFYIKLFSANYFPEYVDLGLSAFKVDVEIDLLNISNEYIYDTVRLCALSRLVNNTYQKIEFEYKAKGGERYVFIGNLSKHVPKRFKAIKPFGIFRTGSLFPYAMFAVDDVFLETIDCVDSFKNVSSLLQKNSAKNRLFCDTIFFNTNKYDLNNNDSLRLNRVVSLLRLDTFSLVKIEGFSDSKGDSLYNINLSLLRACTVANFIVNAGISNSRIERSGLGYSPLEGESKMTLIKTFLKP